MQVIGVLIGGALIPAAMDLVRNWIHRDSETSIRIDRVNDQAIYIRVLNSGRKGSNLGGCTLNFGNGPIETTSLEPIFEDMKKTVIAPGADIIIGYTSSGLMAKNIKKKGLLLQLDNRLATLSIDVEESNNPHHQMQIHIPLAAMRTFISGRIEDDP